MAKTKTPGDDGDIDSVALRATAGGDAEEAIREALCKMVFSSAFEALSTALREEDSDRRAELLGDARHYATAILGLYPNEFGVQSLLDVILYVSRAAEQGTTEIGTVKHSAVERLERD